jgi:hypothetical protein
MPGSSAGRCGCEIMIKAIQLIFAGPATWQRIIEVRWGVLKVLLILVLPLLLFSSLVEGYALLRWGETGGEFRRVTLFSQDTILRYEAGQMGLWLAMLFGGSKLVQWVAGGFRCLPGYAACFRTVAYGLSPLLLVRFLDAVPGMHTWFCWLLGVGLMVRVLYDGVGLAMEPEQSSGFGVFLMVAISLVILSGLNHAFSGVLLHGRLQF